MKLLRKLGSPVVNLVKEVAAKILRERETVLRDRYNVDTVLSASLPERLLSEVREPVAYVEFLRGCIEHTTFSTTPVKDTHSSSGPASIRFRMLLDILQSGVPALAFSQAQEIGLIADKLSSSLDPLQFKGCEWAGDVGLSFRIGSSFARKGRLLSSIIRLCRADRCLELGTAYGMSALFILYALRANGGEGHLTTVEAWDLPFSIASGILKERFGNMVCCRFGRTEEILPSVVESMKGVDFLFHDAGHSREDYVRDFSLVIQGLAPGSIVLFDDIRWDDPRFRVNPPETYRGWREVVGHPRVRQAVEIDRALGLILME
jgi:predicted O-methyltransferase YrrM